MIATFGEGSEVMECNLKNRRKALSVSLDELSAALGPGFSRARLSVAERGLIQLTEPEEKAVVAAIERIGQLRSEVRDVVRRAERVNLAALCSDIREQAQVAAV